MPDDPVAILKHYNYEIVQGSRAGQLAALPERVPVSRVMFGIDSPSSPASLGAPQHNPVRNILPSWSDPSARGRGDTPGWIGLARTTIGFLNTIEAVSKKGAAFKSLADAWADTTTRTAASW